MPVFNCPKCSGPKTQFDADHCEDAGCPLKATPVPARWSGEAKAVTVPETLPKKRGRPAAHK